MVPWATVTRPVAGSSVMPPAAGVLDSVEPVIVALPPVPSTAGALLTVSLLVTGVAVVPPALVSVSAASSTASMPAWTTITLTAVSQVAGVVAGLVHSV
ncbi:hypothetical protein QE386_001842 [Pseudoxanthomonas winnipegensis]|nr:hypothetical protein [Pseudoxanthomonas winnipegensis]MDQ1133247.1 hypothetical protein [Pseudoxanthomonas winnipegensis]